MRMVVQNPSGVRATVSLRGDTVTVGRHESNDVRLPGRNVSRRHCRFDRSGAGISLEDLGSTNGVRVDGVVVSGRVHLGPGQQVQVGDYVLLFDTGNGGTEPPAPASASSLFPGGLDMPGHDDLTPGPPPLPRFRHARRRRRLLLGLGLTVVGLCACAGALWLVVPTGP